MFTELSADFKKGAFTTLGVVFVVFVVSMLLKR